MATKKCEACDQEIGDTEKDCPKCGVNFEELEDAVKTVSTASTVIEKRRKAANPNCDKCGKPKHDGDCTPKPAPKKKSALSGLGNAFRKKA